MIKVPSKIHYTIESIKESRKTNKIIELWNNKYNYGDLKHPIFVALWSDTLDREPFIECLPLFHTSTNLV